VKIKFPFTEILRLEAGYWDNSSVGDIEREKHIESELAPVVRNRGYFTKPEFQVLCRWKTPRSKRLIESNSDEFIQAVTQTALSTPEERLRIEVLTLLRGVSWPTASVLLHFGHHDPYPILDFRALWSLGVNTLPDYEFDFWWEYTQVCRQLAREANVSMRTLDRALWQYSKEKQGNKSG
jgi:hypothetical protein